MMGEGLEDDACLTWPMDHDRPREKRTQKAAAAWNRSLMACLVLRKIVRLTNIL